jgi:hypothetical protein
MDGKGLLDEKGSLDALGAILGDGEAGSARVDDALSGDAGNGVGLGVGGETGGKVSS